MIWRTSDKRCWDVRIGHYPIGELEEQLQELLEKNEELEKKIQQQNKDNKVLEDKLVSAETSRDWAEGEKAELAAQLTKAEAERREAVGALALDTDQYTREIKGLHETLDGLQAEHLKKLEFMNSRCSKHAGNLLAANAKLEERTREVKELRAQLGIEQEEPIVEQDEPEVQENEPQVQEDEPAEEQEATEDETAVDENEQGLTTTTEADLTDDELGFTGSEFAEDDSTELQDQPAGAAASPYGPLKSLLMQERPLAFDDHNPYEEAFRPASPVYGQPDSDAAGPSDALQAVQMFPQERAARNNLARAIQEEKTKLNAAIADLQQEKADEVQAVKDSMNDYLEELDARRIQDLQDADLRRVQDLEAADARRLTDLHEAQSRIIDMWKAFAELIRPMLQYLAALEFIIRQQGIDVSFLEDRRPDAKKTEDELNEMASRNDLVVSPMRLAIDIHPKELIADIPSIRISPPSEELSPTTTAPPPNSPTSDESSPTTTSPTSPTSPTAAFAATGSSCPRLHVYLWPLLAFLFTLLTLFWFAGLSEAERKLWDDANDGARLSTLGHFGYGGRLSYRLFTPVSRTLYNADGGYLGPDDGQMQQQQVWMHPLVRISAALVEPVFASVQVVVAGFAVVVGCLVGLR
ncbi:hypothetical protein BFW01_g12688 [Lasiodiplodia theobromae]|nr:hypothetical protein BFW01_g12688 [Lasiodiplodia theobromae]